MAVFLDLNGLGPLFLNSIPEPVQQPNAGIAGPGEDQLAGATRANHLVIKQIRAQANQCQVTLLLSNDFVAGGEWDKVAEAFKGNGVAVVDQVMNGIRKGGNVRHAGGDANRAP